LGKSGRAQDKRPSDSNDPPKGRSEMLSDSTVPKYYSVSVSEWINFTEQSSVGQAGLCWPRASQTSKRLSLPPP